MEADHSGIDDVGIGVLGGGTGDRVRSLVFGIHSTVPAAAMCPDPAARSVCALLSDWLPATTGAMIMVDGGVHALGV
ncbi:hypothetical protein B0293_20925 [Amycolatopsis azurea DSM 43854]|uniref:Enoyl-[acyl-carrier-protein] reductase n=1 Tax=Amycolatopsis azurea DSM 43854 TaxID=1238180 RepID=M2NU86_9PSEU|nr:Enoyl-[acyl-carrier-protein] reductase [Amycolatopsis azurea DSM 43854]OOC04915.1 hypothetical protein B0293_20925 [Amycolatopsis azurea DSM 43854]